MLTQLKYFIGGIQNPETCREFSTSWDRDFQSTTVD